MSKQYQHTILGFAMLGLLAAPVAHAAHAAAANPEEQFTGFCLEWMKKLEVRERDNIKMIHWQPVGSVIEGAYTGYSTDHTCVVKPNPDPKAVRVGKVIYQEIRYIKRGPSQDEASAAPPEAVERTEVTEIFRYGKDKWEY